MDAPAPTSIYSYRIRIANNFSSPDFIGSFTSEIDAEEAAFGQLINDPMLKQSHYRAEIHITDSPKRKSAEERVILTIGERRIVITNPTSK